MVDTRSILVADKKFCKVTFCSYMGQPEKKYYLLKNVSFDLYIHVLKHEVDISYPNFKVKHFMQLHGLLNHGYKVAYRYLYVYLLYSTVRGNVKVM